jgi:hypothetical protein
MKQQTALDWYLEKMFELNMQKGLSKRQYLGRRYRIEKGARNMERKQIVEAHGMKVSSGFRGDGNFFYDVVTGDDYFNQHYEDSK